MIGKALVISATVFVLSACVSNSEYYANQRMQASNECAGMGYERGTSTHLQCLQMIYSAKQERQNRMGQIVQDSLKSFGGGYQQPVYPPLGLSPQINCTSRNIAGTIHTSCN